VAGKRDSFLQGQRGGATRKRIVDSAARTQDIYVGYAGLGSSEARDGNGSGPS